MKKLVAYFSASGVTAERATQLANVLNAELLEIKAKQPYTDADLNWNNTNSRSSVEMSNLNSRPEIVKNLADLSQFDVIYLGFPIWWHVAPTIINTFLESYDFSGKTIVLFATSGGSDFGETIKYLKPSCADSTKIIEGGLLNFDIDDESLKTAFEDLAN